MLRIYRGESEMRSAQILSKGKGKSEAQGVEDRDFCHPSIVDVGFRGAEPLQHPWSTFATRPLRGCSSVWLVIAGDRDAALAAARFTSPHELWPSQSQQTVR